MTGLAVYDSQGDGIGDHAGEHSDRIQRFFFDGVRLALDATGAETELVVFFRARESETSRSEQYFAVYRGPVETFVRTLRQTVEDEYGLSIVTTTDDTAVYELFEREGTVGDPPPSRAIERATARLGGSGGSRRSPPGGRPGGTVSGGVSGQVRVGVGSYERASQVVAHVRERGQTERVAIAENADSPHLEAYDLVVEKGDHSGVVLLDGADESDRQSGTGRSDPAGQQSDESGSRRRLVALVAALVLLALLVGAMLVGVPFP